MIRRFVEDQHVGFGVHDRGKRKTSLLSSAQGSDKLQRQVPHETKSAEKLSCLLFALCVVLLHEILHRSALEKIAKLFDVMLVNMCHSEVLMGVEFSFVGLVPHLES